MTSKTVSGSMKQKYYDGFLDMMEILSKKCKRNLIANLLTEMGTDKPLEFGIPVYGKDDTRFIEFLAPGIFLATVFFFPLISSSVTFIVEKKNNTLDRAVVAGIGMTDFMAGYLLIQLFILMGQTAISFVILIYFIGLEVIGSIWLTLLLPVMVGISGMSAGFLIGVFCKDEFQAMLLSMATFFPNMLLAGFSKKFLSIF